MKKSGGMMAAAVAASAAMAIGQEAEIGKAAPAFTLKDVSGAEVALESFRGKIVVLEWTNYDCPFVRKHYESENMQTLQRDYGAKGIVWLSICSSAQGKQGHFTPEEWTRRMAAWKVAPKAVLLDPEGQVGRAYGAKTTPHLFIINAEGILVYAGGIDDTPSANKDDVATAKNYVRAALDALLAGRPVPEAATKPYGCSVKY